MLNTLIATFRDGLEAVLTIGVLLALVEKIDKRKQKNVLAGIIIGLSFIVLATLAVFLTGKRIEEFSGNFPLFEGWALIISGILLVLSVSTIEGAAKNLRVGVAGKFQESLKRENGLMLVLIPALVLIIEGTEVIIVSLNSLLTGNLYQFAAGLIGGFVLSALSLYLIFKTAVKINLMVTIKSLSVVLLLLSLALINHGVHELTEIGFLPLKEYRFSQNDILNNFLKVGIGIKGEVSLLQLGLVLLYSFGIYKFLNSKSNSTSLN